MNTQMVAELVAPVAWRWKWNAEFSYGEWGWDYGSNPPTNHREQRTVEPLYSADALASMQSHIDAADAKVVKSAALEVLAERERQKTVEGWTTEHDDHHDDGQLALAAACYALPDWQRSEIKTLTGAGEVALVQRLWPWNSFWKPKDVRADLVRAGALIIAEIERLDRVAALSRIVAREVSSRPPRASPDVLRRGRIDR